MSARSISLTEFEQVVLRFEPKIRAAYLRALRSAAMRLEGMIVEEIDRASPYPAVDTGELRRSADTTFVPDGAIVSVRAPHAPMMEYGARPFMPPLAPLIEWVLRKGLAKPFGPQPKARRTKKAFGPQPKPAEYDRAERVARAIQFSIAAKGIAPRQYFSKAWARLPPVLRIEVWKALAKMGS